MDAFVRQHLAFACAADPGLYFPYGRVSFLRSMLRWHREAVSTACFATGITESFTAILQSYRRPWNIEPMARLLLRLDCIDRVIITNNNPSVDLRQSVSLHDPRMTLITQPIERPASMMAMIAYKEAQSRAQRFLSIDDDLFLFPEQIEVLLRAFTKDPSVPHGLIGQSIDAGGRVRHHVTGERTVDILHRVYAFTADHIHRYVQLLDPLGYATCEEKMMLPYGSDIVLSHAGNGKPKIHAAGTFLSCPTNEKPGIAKFREQGFAPFREMLQANLKKLQLQKTGVEC